MFYRFAIVFDDATPNVKFYINRSLVATITTHLPGQNTATAQAWFCGMSYAGATIINDLINQIQIWGDI